MIAERARAAALRAALLALALAGLASLSLRPSAGVFPWLAAALLLYRASRADRASLRRGALSVLGLVAAATGAMALQVWQLGMAPLAWPALRAGALQASLLIVVHALGTAAASWMKRFPALAGEGRGWARSVMGEGAVFALFVPAILLSTATHRPAGVLHGPTVQEAGGEAVWLRAPDGVELSALFLEAQGPRRGAVLLVHGLGAEKIQFLAATDALREKGFAVMTLDLRGHGQSGGATCTLGLAEAGDVAAAWTELLRRTPSLEGPRLLFGISLGGAAVQLAAPELEGVGGMILDSTFARVDHVVPRAMPLPPAIAPLALALGRAWALLVTGMPVLDAAPVDAATRNHGRYPVLVIHADQDPLVPYGEALALSTAYGARAELVTLAGSYHPNGHLNAPAIYRSALLRLLERASAASRRPLPPGTTRGARTIRSKGSIGSGAGCVGGCPGEPRS